MSYTEANAIGATRYFTGKSCKRGHIAERMAANGICLECHRLRMAALYVPGKTPEPQLRWQRNNPERLKEVQKASREKNGWKHVESKRRWAAKNGEQRRAAMKIWRGKNPQAYRDYQKLRNDRIRAAGGDITSTDVDEMVVRQGGMCRYCPWPLSSGFQTDHRIPVIKGGRSDATNIQLVCEPCNRRKGTRDPDEYECSIGFTAENPVWTPAEAA